MNELFNWFANLPTYFAQAADWLTTPIDFNYGFGSLTFTPLAAVGVSFGAVLAVVIVLKIKSLIF